MAEEQSDKILELRVRPEDRRRLLELLEKNWEHNKDVPPEEIEAAIDEAVREVGAEGRREEASE